MLVTAAGKACSDTAVPLELDEEEAGDTNGVVFNGVARSNGSDGVVLGGRLVHLLGNGFGESLAEDRVSRGRVYDLECRIEVDLIGVGSGRVELVIQ